jgi:membrane protease YdiL (CAAX protease family)
VSAFRRTAGIRYPEQVFPAPDHQPPVPDVDAPRPEIKQRIVALLEVLICSDVPTQLAISATLVALGYKPYGSSGELQVAFVVALSLIDAVFLIGLIVLFLYSHGESPRAVLFGRRRIAAEIAYGIPLTLIALGAGIGMLLAIQFFLPWLHSVEENPLAGLLRSPRDVWLFVLVVLVAGGVREEIQRAFLLHRFEGWLGGGTVGVIVTSVAFGAGHLLQGYDAAIVTGLLGAFWGVIYLRRRSVVAPMVSHAGFDLLQIVQFVTLRASGFRL